MRTSDIYDQLLKLNVGQVLKDVSLADCSKWRIGGQADLMVLPASIDQISRLRKYISDTNVSSIVIGEASNLLFDDAGFHGVVIKIGRAFSSFTIKANKISTQSGVAVPRLARAAGLAGLTGIEHTIGIPGTLGGLVSMNGGSMRKGIGQVVTLVKAVDRSGHIKQFNPKQCEFGYRHSVFQTTDLIVAEVELELESADIDSVRSLMLDVLRQRRTKFPRREPNCGSVFKSQAELYDKFGPPGKVIEDAGLKGLTVGQAQVSQKHANFIINTGQAQAKDVIELISRIRRTIHQRINIWMECEVRFVSCNGTVSPAHKIAHDYCRTC